MPKITSNNINGILIKYGVKIALSTIFCIMMLNAVSSFFIMKFDINLSVLPYIGIAVCIISSIFIPFISLSGFKNNYLVLSMLSVIPLMIYCTINFCIYKTSAVFIIIKIAGIIVSAFAVSLIKSSKK